MKKAFRTFRHTADIGFFVYGTTLEELYTNAAYAFYKVLTDFKPSILNKKKKIIIKGITKEELWVKWFNELIFQFEVNSLMLFKLESFIISKSILKAVGYFQKVKDIEVKTGVKAATYHKASVEKHKNGFRGTIILDV